MANLKQLPAALLACCLIVWVSAPAEGQDLDDLVQNHQWILTGGPPGRLGYDIRQDLEQPEVMYVTDAYLGVFKSVDGGMTWEAVNNGIDAMSGESADAVPVFCRTIRTRCWPGQATISTTKARESTRQPMEDKPGP